MNPVVVDCIYFILFIIYLIKNIWGEITQPMKLLQYSTEKRLDHKNSLMRYILPHKQ